MAPRFVARCANHVLASAGTTASSPRRSNAAWSGSASGSIPTRCPVATSLPSGTPRCSSSGWSPIARSSRPERRGSGSPWPDQPTCGGVAISMASQPPKGPPPRHLGAVPPAQAEESLGEEEVQGDRQVDHRSDEFEDADSERQFVHLIGNEEGRGHEREVLGPPLVEPKSHHLERFESGVGEEHEGQGDQVRRRVLEGTPEEAEDASGLGRAGVSSCEVVHDVRVVAGARPDRDGQT